MIPRRGEVWIVDLGLAQKTRPSLVISTAYSDEDRALITVVAHTTKVRGSKFEVSVPVPFLKAGAFVVQSIVTIPAKLALRRVGVLSAEQLKFVEDGVRRWLAL
jgi:mRNA interferase MazF